MASLTIITHIKDLLILKYPSLNNITKGYINSAKQKGLYLDELVINPYILQSRSLDVSYLFKYLESLDKLAGVFRELYDEYIYTLRLNGWVNDIIYSIDKFHEIFNAINNKFNSYLTDQYLFEDFSIYQSETSLETCMAMYDTFNEYFMMSLLDIAEPNKLKYLIMQKSIRYSQYIYDKIFEQFEYIYLPFY